MSLIIKIYCASHNFFSKSKRELSKYKVDSVIGVIKRNDEDQQRRLKYLPPASTKEDTRRSFSTHHTLQSMMLESSFSTSTAPASSYKSAESKISTATKAINLTLPKGQKTIKGN